ncbi:hypothetical protein HPB51_020461 [Rhipicephalus microplus]|uniref:Uncharacterized protein n=1 Tax=Rhipicephalus microplus TaxID=6941 RepID=A0A9J6DCD8_RHIMP|nr:hypothetical protein HPB51_020461 [Rhipicephalus microplus]
MPVDPYAALLAFRTERLSMAEQHMAVATFRRELRNMQSDRLTGLSELELRGSINPRLPRCDSTYAPIVLAKDHPVRTNTLLDPSSPGTRMAPAETTLPKVATVTDVAACPDTCLLPPQACARE